MTCYEELKARGLIAQVTNEEEISKMVNEGKAVFYIGFDPTADSLHVGHFMALCLMKRLQMAGNRPIALIGGGTGYIGDPSGRTDMRSMMTPETIQHNCDCFKKQMERFIEFGEGKAQMVNNADWLLKLNYIDLLRDVGACFSVNNMLRAKCYEQRMEKGLSFLEFNYMIMQSYDFYYLFQHYGCNMQFGGDDQWSNMLGGTELIRKKLGKDAHAMTITLLLNSEGKKMGKTAKGAVWLDPEKTSPYEFYQYWRNVGDDDVLKCLRMLTFLPLEQIDEMDKWEGSQLNTAKEILAFELTKLVHGEEEAQKAQDAAKALFVGGGDMSNVPATTLTEADLTDGSIGILPDIITTVCTVLTTLLVVLPLGVCAAVYLTEYAANKRVVAVIEYAAETLSGIPSIIYGLVGQMFFCQFLGMKKSLLAGAMTLVIMNLPTIMRTTQESLKTVPQSYREGAFGLGAGKWRTIRTVVLPGCVDGVLTGCILAVGRILGETAALLYTAGFAHTLYNSLRATLEGSGATLSVALYVYAKEQGEFDVAFAIAAILMALALLINLAAMLTGRYFKKRRSL